MGSNYLILPVLPVITSTTSNYWFYQLIACLHVAPLSCIFRLLKLAWCGISYECMACITFWTHFEFNGFESISSVCELMFLRRSWTIHSMYVYHPNVEFVSLSLIHVFHVFELVPGPYFPFVELVAGPYIPCVWVDSFCVFVRFLSLGLWLLLYKLIKISRMTIYSEYIDFCGSVHGDLVFAVNWWNFESFCFFCLTLRLFLCLFNSGLMNRILLPYLSLELIVHILQRLVLIVSRLDLLFALVNWDTMHEILASISSYTYFIVHSIYWY